MYFSISEYIYICRYMSIYAYVYIYIMCMCIYVYIYISVCVRVGSKQGSQTQVASWRAALAAAATGVEAVPVPLRKPRIFLFLG